MAKKRTEEENARRFEAVMALLRREESAAKLSRRYGMCEATLYRLRDEFLSGGKEALSRQKGKSADSHKMVELEKAVAERDQVIGEITIANRILKKNSKPPDLTREFRKTLVSEVFSQSTASRLTKVLGHLGIPTTSWYRKPCKKKPGRRGPKPKPIPEEIVNWVVATAQLFPWHGYKRIAVICRRDCQKVTNRQAYRIMKKHDLLQKRKRTTAELHQASKLYELLPTKSNELWQMDVTYIHVPGYGWRYGITVIDYYSRYLLALHFTASYSTMEVERALMKARAEAERVHGPLKIRPFLVTDNGPSFISGRFNKYVEPNYEHVRIQYRTPTQLGLLERFHKTLKTEEVYWRLYDNPQHAQDCLAEFHYRYNHLRPHWALVPDTGGDPYVPAEVYRDSHAVKIPKWQPWARKAKGDIEKAIAAEAA